MQIKQCNEVSLNQLIGFPDEGIKADLDKVTADFFKQLLELEEIKQSVLLFQHLIQNHKTSDVVRWIDVYEIDKFCSSTNSYTLMHLMAYSPWNSAYPVIISKSKNLDPIRENERGDNALDIAVLEGNLQFVKEIYPKVASISFSTLERARLQRDKSLYSAEIYHVLKTPFKQNKSAIIAKKPFWVTSLDQIKKPYAPLVAICSQVYYDGDLQILNQLFIRQLSEFLDYSKSPLMAPLLYVVAMGALGKHEKGSNLTKPKFLKIVLKTGEDISAFSPGLGNSCGLFTYKSTVFAALGATEEKMRLDMSVIFHEACHFVAFEVMKNRCKPYKKIDSARKIKCGDVIQKTKANLDSLLWRVKNKALTPDKYEKCCLICFKNIFKGYPQNEWGMELIVLFAQTTSLLGYERGCEFLKNNFPEFFDFYVYDFNPACINYLIEKNAVNWLDLSPEFIDVLRGFSEDQASREISDSGLAKNRQ